MFISSWVSYSREKMIKEDPYVHHCQHHHHQLLFVGKSPERKGELSGLKRPKEGFPGGAVVKNLPANAGDTGSSPGLGRSHMLRSN